MSSDYEGWLQTGKEAIIEMYAYMYNASLRNEDAEKRDFAFKWMQDLRIGLVFNRDEGTFHWGDRVGAKAYIDAIKVNAEVIRSGPSLFDFRFISHGPSAENGLIGGALESFAVFKIGEDLSGAITEDASGSYLSLTPGVYDAEEEAFLREHLSLGIKYALAGEDFEAALAVPADLASIFGMLDTAGFTRVAVESTSQPVDELDASNLVLGASGSSTLKGGAGDDVLFGGGGGDEFEGGSGSDLILGDRESNQDKATYERSEGGIVVNFADDESGMPADAFLVRGDGLGGRDTLFSMEELEGSAHADQFILSGTPAVRALREIVAGAGDDTVKVNAGAFAALVDNA